MKDGICYEYENDKLSQIVLYENGMKKRVMNRFIEKNRMIEYDEKNQIVYKGEYEGNVKNHSFHQYYSIHHIKQLFLQ